VSAKNPWGQQKHTDLCWMDIGWLKIADGKHTITTNESFRGVESCMHILNKAILATANLIKALFNFR
jgi:hypothetical protein